MRTITPNHVLCPHSLSAALLLPALSNQSIRIIFRKITPEQTIVDARSLALSRFRLLLGQISQLNSDGVDVWRVVVAVLVDVQGLW